MKHMVKPVCPNLCSSVWIHWASVSFIRHRFWLKKKFVKRNYAKYLIKRAGKERERDRSGQDKAPIHLCVVSFVHADVRVRENKKQHFCPQQLSADSPCSQEAQTSISPSSDVTCSWVMDGVCTIAVCASGKKQRRSGWEINKRALFLCSLPPCFYIRWRSSRRIRAHITETMLADAAAFYLMCVCAPGSKRSEGFCETGSS